MRNRKRIEFLEEALMRVREDMIELINFQSALASHMALLLDSSKVKKTNSISKAGEIVGKTPQPVRLATLSIILYVKSPVETGEIIGENPPGAEEPCNVPSQITLFPP